MTSADIAPGNPTTVDQHLIQRNCPQCGSEGFQRSVSYSKDAWNVGNCLECDFVYLRNVPVYDRMIDEFAWEKTAAIETRRREIERPATKKISTALRSAVQPLRVPESKLFEKLFQPGPVLDVGCGNGRKVSAPFTPFGVELSRGLQEIADKRMRGLGGYCVHAPAIEGIGQFENNFFSGIILSSFLEHDWQPKELLSRAHRVLRVDGGVYIRLPNFASVNRKVRGSKWCGFRYPDHVNYFTPNSLRTMAADCGFQMRILNSINLAFDDNIKAVLTKHSPSTEH